MEMTCKNNPTSYLQTLESSAHRQKFIVFAFSYFHDCQLEAPKNFIGLYPTVQNRCFDINE